MDYQTTIDNRQPASDQSAMGLWDSISSFFHDLFTLAGLQWELLMEDGREAAKSGLLMIGIAIGGVVFVLCAIPVALLGIAHLVSLAGMPLAYALLLVAVLSGALGVATAIYAGRRIHGSLDVFRRSQTEFQRNVAWLKKVTSRKGSKHAHQDPDLYY